MITQIVTFLIWPVFIYASLKLCEWALKKYEAKQRASGIEES